MKVGEGVQWGAEIEGTFSQRWRWGGVGGMGAMRVNRGCFGNTKGWTLWGGKGMGCGG